MGRSGLGFPYHLFVFLFPMHHVLYVVLLFLVGFWTMNIHDRVSGCSPAPAPAPAPARPPLTVQCAACVYVCVQYTFNWWGVNGAAHHTIHHTKFLYNYGQVLPPLLSHRSALMRVRGVLWLRDARDAHSTSRFGTVSSALGWTRSRCRPTKTLSSGSPKFGPPTRQRTNPKRSRLPPPISSYPTSSIHCPAEPRATGGFGGICWSHSRD